MTRTWIHDLADDLGISGGKDRLLEFAHAVNNPATAEALYELYCNSLHIQSRPVTKWDDLTAAQRTAWKHVADGHRTDAPPVTPIDMILYCPACGTQHIDAPENTLTAPCEDDVWTNPPHRSHLCASCGHIWRPADVPTNGVSAIATRGKDDKALIPTRQSAASILRELVRLKDLKDRLEAREFAGPLLSKMTDAEFATARDDYLQNKPKAWDDARRVLGL